MKYDGIKKADIVLKVSKDVIKSGNKKSHKKRYFLKTLLFQALAAVVLGGLYYGAYKIDNQFINTITGEVRRAIIYNVGYELDKLQDAELVDKIFHNRDKKNDA